MRILQVFNRYLERGGEEASVERISNILSEHHTVFHCYFDSQMWKYDTSLWGTIKQGALMFYNPEATDRFHRHITACKPDIILIHNIFPVGSMGVLNAATKLQIPVMHVVHNFRPFSVNGYLWADGRILPQGLKLDFTAEIFYGAWQSFRIKTAILAFVLWVAHSLGVYRKIDCWLAISDFMRNTFIKAGLAEEKVHLLRHSWDPFPTTADISLSSSPYLLFLGRLTESKGISAMLAAWKLARKQVPHARLLICGSGPMEDEVKTILLDLPECEYLGQVDGGEKEKLLSQATALVVPSVWWEPLGLVVYEAYNYSKPVLAARSGGLTETIIDGVTGWIHEPGNEEELAKHMVEALLDQQKSNHLGIEGYKWLMANTSVQSWLNEFEQISEQTIHRKKGAATDGGSLKSLV